MKQKTVVLILLVLLSSLVFAIEDNSENPVALKKSQLSIGIGLGIPYGVIGGMVEFTPIDYVGLCGGLGYAIYGVGYSCGLHIYPMTNQNSLAPYLAAYYGVVGAITNWEETFNGCAFGGGLYYMPKHKMFLSAEALILAFTSVHNSASKFKIAFGWHWKL